MTGPLRVHGPLCRCNACSTSLAMRTAPRTTPSDQIEAGLDLSLRFLEPLKAKNAELQKRVDDMAYVLQTAIHNGEDFAAYTDMCNWGPELTMDHLKRLKAWADETNERRAGC